MEPLMLAVARLLARVEQEKNEYGEGGEVRFALDRLQVELRNVIDADTTT